jgi:hypothetical protein
MAGEDRADAVTAAHGSRPVHAREPAQLSDDIVEPPPGGDDRWAQKALTTGASTL